ncbi:amino acid ABC transporter permease [Cupriavidus basilensis]|uniref:amino acid ABC transporter permease n=1 Tax=Cupriavidus basilensis TaxID=68895 RepID=UPI0028484488|nr:amino acid ABC transporter permease [Cupriavidus basilensis]MDR3385389.1 amino acid ABC transporter permease [Cupriavidus basilensis]
MKKIVATAFALCLGAASIAAQAQGNGKVDPYTQGAKAGKADPYTDGAKAGKPDPYTDGAKAGDKFDPYTQGANKSSRANLTDSKAKKSHKKQTKKAVPATTAGA